MIPYNQQQNDVTSSGVGQTTEFSFTGGEMLINFLKGAYKNPRRIVTQETAQNASEVGPDGQFHIHFPTALEPWLSVIDDGIGMSKEDTIMYGSGVGASTKSGDNTKVGGFGIGMKTPFALVDQYLVISRWDSMEYTFTAYLDESNKPQFSLMSERVTAKCNGFEIRVPIETDQIPKMVEDAKDALRFFSPKPTTNIDIEWSEINYSKSGIDWGILEHDGDNYGRRIKSCIVMGNLHYPLDVSNIRVEYRDIYSKVIDYGAVMQFPIGTIELPMSREDIKYTDKNIQLIRDKVDEIVAVFKAELQADIDATPNLYKASLYLSNMRNIISDIGININDLTWKGNDLNNRWVTTPKFCHGYSVPKFRWQYKSLSLQDYHVNTNRLKDDTIVDMYDTLPYDKFKVLVVDSTTKKLPSRLLNWVNDNGYTDQHVYLFVADPEQDDYPNTKQSIRDKLAVMGWPDVLDFDEVVPDYKVTRAKAKKTAKVYTMQANMWCQTDRDYWRDGPDIDLDTTTGIYVDVRNHAPYGHQGWYMSKIKDTIKTLKDNGYIPEDTVVYGCPGSHKNKLEGHPNFISIEEAADIAIDVASTLNTRYSVKYKRYQEVKMLKDSDPSLFKLDISVNNSYYSSCKRVIDKFKDTIQFSKNYTDYTSTFTILNLLRDNNLEELGMTRTKDNFFNRYPLLQHVNADESNAAYIKDYIELKEFCK